MAKRVDVGSIADEIADRIVGGESDERLSWLQDERVKVDISRIFLDASGYRQTVQGRRKRLREALIERLRTKGWTHLGRNTFGQLTPCGS
jgi:hypothetical protein